MEIVKLFIIPGWVQRALIRNNLNIVDVTDYAKMRKILSVQDMAEWVFLSDRYQINDTYLAPTTLDNMFENITKEQRTEFNNSVVPLSETDDIALSINSKLSASNSMSSDAYQFICTGDNIYVIINEGFGKKIANDSNTLLDFIKNYLKVCYSKYSLSRVSVMGIYNLYVKLV